MKTATRKTSPRAFRIVRENGYIVRIIDKNYATVEGGRLPHRVGGGEYHLTTLDPRRLQVGGDEYHLTTLDPRRLQVGGDEHDLTTLDPRRLQVGGDEHDVTTLDPRRLQVGRGILKN